MAHLDGHERVLPKRAAADVDGRHDGHAGTVQRFRRFGNSAELGERTKTELRALDDFDGTDEFEEVDEFEDEWDEDVGVEADWDVEVDGYCEAGDCGEEFLDDAV